jgi:hypothetical protein
MRWRRRAASGRALGAEREGRRQALGAARFERARGVGQEGLRQQEAVFGPMAGSSVARRGGKKRTGPGPGRGTGARTGLRPRRQRADDQQRIRCIGGRRRHLGTQAARQASSPCVKVVSMPLPE